MSEHDEFDTDDAEIATLLRRAGTRADPPADMAREVQAAVHAEWQHVVAARQRRRTFVWAAAASICAIAAGAVVAVQWMSEEGRPVATLARASGEVFVLADGNWARVAAGQRIAVGDAVRSDAPAALLLDNGLALRLDRGTAFDFEASDRLALNAGAVYVDAKPGDASRAFVVTTHAGDVRHLGTQYLVRTNIDGIDVSVREGRVSIANDAGTAIATAGERLQVSVRGDVQRSHIASTDERWRWASDVAPPFAIENASLAAFLDWIARETGRALIYQTPQAQSAATNVTLHGSIEGLAPEIALTAVLATTPLRRDSAKADVIEIGFAEPIDSGSGTRPTP